MVLTMFSPFVSTTALPVTASGAIPKASPHTEMRHRRLYGARNHAQPALRPEGDRDPPKGGQENGGLP